MFFSFFSVVLIVLLSGVRICVSNHPLVENFTPFTGEVDVDNGIMMCAGNHMVPGLIHQIWQIRSLWKSNLSIAIAHCGEIAPDNIDILMSMDRTIKVVDLCRPDSTVLDTNMAETKYRLRGFFCKIAAMIESPFRNTMVMDLDVMWFKSPEKLFRSRIFETNGAVFFRDRVYSRSAGEAELSELTEMMRAKGFGDVDYDRAYALAQSNGINYYWHGVASRLAATASTTGGPSMHMNATGDKERGFSLIRDVQDSSVVLMDRWRHPGTVKVLGQLLHRLNYGYGDKELFWIAATIAQEPFSFEPFLAGQLGDCYGVMIHFDPDDADGHHGSLTSHIDEIEQQAQPLYVNAEYFVEDTTVVGEWFPRLMSYPVLATNSKRGVVDMNTWPGAKGRGDEGGCTCSVVKCVEVSSSVREHLLLAEWVTVRQRVKLQSNGGRAACMRTRVAVGPVVTEVMTSMVSPEHCPFLGCVALPVTINMTAPCAHYAAAEYCDPVVYSREAVSGDALARAAHARSMQRVEVADGLPVQFGYGKDLHYMKNGTLYLIPSFDRFVQLGLDLSQVVRVNWDDYSLYLHSSESA